MGRPFIICIIGRTCSGKDTLVKKLCAEGSNFSPIISFTDRPKRTDETHGVEHYFLKKENFDELIEEKKDDIIAYTEIKKDDATEGYRYCALRNEFEEFGHNIYVIDPKGYKELKEKLPKVDIRSIYIYCPDEDRYARAKATRSDFETEFEKRNANEDEQFSEFEKHHMATYVIDNSNARGISQSFSVLSIICEGIKRSSEW